MPSRDTFQLKEARQRHLEESVPATATGVRLGREETHAWLSPLPAPRPGPAAEGRGGSWDEGNPVQDSSPRPLWFTTPPSHGLPRTPVLLLVLRCSGADVLILTHVSSDTPHKTRTVLTCSFPFWCLAVSRRLSPSAPFDPSL